MRKIVLSTIVLLITLISYGQSGANRQLDSFDAVSAQEGIDVYLTKGGSETARIEADGIDIEDVLTEVRGGMLKIHLAGDNHRSTDVSVYVTYRDLKALSASSAASVKVQDKVEVSGDFDISASSAGSVDLNLSANEVDVDVSSSGNVRLQVAASELNAEVSSAGDIDISGQTNFLLVRASSSGDFKGSELTTKEAETRASSGASIRLRVTEKLEARASSGASIRYKGDPKNVDADSSSGGSVRKF